MSLYNNKINGDGIKVNDKIVWECLKDEHIERIAESLGYDDEYNKEKWNNINEKIHQLFKKHGLNPYNCCFNEDILGKEDMVEYYRLDRDRNDEWARLKREYTDRCIDWLMENGYWLKIIKD